MIITLCDICADKMAAAYSLERRGGYGHKCSLCQSTAAVEYNAVSNKYKKQASPVSHNREKERERRRWA